MFNTVLAVHVAAGSVALLSMFVPMVTRKGGRLHRRAGWTFVGSMAIVSATAFALSIALRSLLLLVVTLVTANGVWSAVRVLRRKGTTPRGQWAVQHITSILGSCIAATTAFLVNTADNFGIWPLAAWLAPTVIGVPAIRIWVAHDRRRIAARKETSMTPASTFAREAAGIALLALLIFSPSLAPLLAQSRDLRRGPDLVAGLKATPGVLGVDTAQTSGGKQVIFAWFENKQAVLNWYYSGTHQQAMRLFAPGGASDRAPLAHIKDDSGPIMAIASLTIVDTPQVGGVSLPVSQIAIELYAPLPGGLAAGGRFAPATLKVPGLIEVQ
ncbi:MAG: hypothetical protein FJW14_06245 [Acidimicrobiia bacterium]|nr:hypothetical protein [Acidimicrobiia bacterium]